MLDDGGPQGGDAGVRVIDPDVVDMGVIQHRQPHTAAAEECGPNGVAVPKAPAVA
jgi:hypothetical protein